MNHQKSRVTYLFSQPHQPFFGWGVVNALLMMLLFLLTYKGVLTPVITPNAFHAYSLIFIVFTAFFQGFLLTTFPRFSQMPPLDQKIYTTNFTLLFTGTLLFGVGAFTTPWLLYPGMVLLLVNQLFTLYAFYQIYKASPSPDKYDQFWIVTAFASGIAAHLIFIIALAFDLPFAEEAAKKIAVYLYLVFVALSVGQRMIPFFSHVMISKNRNLLKSVYALFAAAIVTDLIAGSYGFVFMFAASALIARELLRWKLPWKKAEPILWILHLAIFWLPLGLFLGAAADLAALLLEQNWLFIAVHFVLLGFVTTVLVGFGTRVTLGHSGNMMQTDEKTKILFYLTQIVLYMRIIYSFTGTPFLFDITVALWLLLFGGWAVKYFPALLFGEKVK
ncbi:MAG: NnrS family protein [Sulfurospirillum sp.]|nr:MAG: NnrS family protein [Sulfurospirillum sp.]